MHVAFDTFFAANDANKISSHSPHSAASVAVIIFGAFVVAALIAGLSFLRLRFKAKDDEIFNKTGADVEQAAVHVQTPTTAPSAERQVPKPGSV